MGRTGGPVRSEQCWRLPMALVRLAGPGLVHRSRPRPLGSHFPAPCPARSTRPRIDARRTSADGGGHGRAASSSRASRVPAARSATQLPARRRAPPHGQPAGPRCAAPAAARGCVGLRRSAPRERERARHVDALCERVDGPAERVELPLGRVVPVVQHPPQLGLLPVEQAVRVVPTHRGAERLNVRRARPERVVYGSLPARLLLRAGLEALLQLLL